MTIPLCQTDKLALHECVDVESRTDRTQNLSVRYAGLRECDEGAVVVVDKIHRVQLLDRLDRPENQEEGSFRWTVCAISRFIRMLAVCDMGAMRTGRIAILMMTFVPIDGSE